MMKTLILTLVTACSGVTTNMSPGDVDRDIDPGPPADQHFCCNKVNDDWTGEGCTAVSKEHINACQNVLYCPGAWRKVDNKVTCDV